MSNKKISRKPSGVKKPDSTPDAILMNWYYERLQATGRSQSRMLWSGIILSLCALLILLDPVNAKKIDLFGIPLQSIENILPTIIFLLLAILQGSFIAARDSLEKINKTKSITGVYEIDKNLNFIDYLAFVFNKKGWGRFEPLLYPVFIIFIAAPAIILLCQQIFTYPISWIWVLILVNLLTGIFCGFVSLQFFQERWKRFSPRKKKKQRAREKKAKKKIS
jgi:uncharacterized protein YneF (UPF0154 family)